MKRLRQKSAELKIYFQKHTFQNIISISFALVLVLGLGAVVLLSYLRYSRVFEKVVEEKNIQILDQTNQYLDASLRSMMKISDSLYYQVIKNKDFGTSDMSYELKLFYNSNQDKIVSIALFDSFGQAVDAIPLSNIKENVDIRSQEWFQNATSSIENLSFSSPHVQNIFKDESEYHWVVSLSRSVQITKGTQVEQGVLLLDMNFSGIEQVCKSVALGSDSYMYLMDKDGEIIYHPRQQLLYSGIEKESHKEASTYHDGSHMETFQGVERMVTVKTVGYTGWKLVAVTPVSDMAHQYLQIQEFAFFIFLFGALGLIIMTKLVSEKIANPIKQLEVTMSEIAEGHLDLQIQTHGSYEIEHLGESLNALVCRMKELMSEAVTKETAKRRSELDALQTQINPHFLYNTLDSIIWMIENERYEGAIHMITSLARYFRISLSKGKNIISVADELEHARNYLAIQQVRYKDKFTYEIITDEEAPKLATLKFIIQPMIENAIYHGLAYMGKEDDGKIVIHAYCQGDDLYIDIIDNGVGITPQDLANMQDNTHVGKRKESGIGMRNVWQRIRLYFGEDYGLTIISEPDEGCTIRIHLPKRTMEEIEDEGQML